MKNTYILVSILIQVALAGYSLETDGQNNANLKYDKSGNIKYIKFDGVNKTGVWNSPSSSDMFFSNILGVKDLNKFTLKNKIERKDGSYYESYRQTYNDIEVEGGIYILHFKNRKLVKANGHFVNITEMVTSPKLTPEEASKSYSEYLQVPDSVPLHFFHGIVITEIEEVSGNDTVNTARLCYKIDLLNIPTDNGETGYIDAQSGKVLKTSKTYNDHSATGSFYTLYSDTKTAGTQFYNNIYNLCDSSRNAAIHTWDLNNTIYENYLSNRVEFTDNNNTWTEGEHSTNYDQMALDIHWALQKIYDYFFDNHEEFEGFDGDNHNIDAYAHCYLPNGYGGYTKDNAGFAWFPNGYEAFFFGDGESIFNPVAALDAVSHEYGHAITHNFTGLEYDNNVMSAINEGFSDIWGAVIEHKVAPEKICWKIGEEIIKVSGDDCLRNIEDPESPSANTQIADTYGDDTYTYGNYYAKSGVMSHWFYLLAQGGTGTNDNDDNYTVYGLGIENAAKIVFEGQTGHFGAVDSYPEARTAMIDASDQINGENSIQSLQVANAWYAVGVGMNPGQVTISGPSLVCSSGSTFSISPSVSFDSIRWNSSYLLNITFGQGTNSCTFASIGNGSSYVSVTLYANGNSITLPQKTVWAGGPTVGNIQGPDGLPDQCIHDYWISAQGYPSYDWGIPPRILCPPGLEWQILFNEYTSSATYFAGCAAGSISVRVSNQCGYTNKYKYIDIGSQYSCDGGYKMLTDTTIKETNIDEIRDIVIYPNPASDNIQVSLVNTSTSRIISDESTSNIYSVKIFSSNGILMTSLNKTGIPFTLALNGLQNGTYILIVSDDKNTYQKQFLVNHLK